MSEIYFLIALDIPSLKLIVQVAFDIALKIDQEFLICGGQWCTNRSFKS